MGWFGWWRRGRGAGSLGSPNAAGAGAGGRRQLLDREAGPADLEHLRIFAKTRTGVEFYVEPETTATDTTVVAVAVDGEWTRRRVGSPRGAQRLARRAGVPIYDVTVVGYPAAMRRWNARAKADRELLERRDDLG